jgi:Arc/MetJ-type ribon-helix-helix transcriptional regulator
MRNIINISLPVELTKVVKKEVKTGNYASVSEYFRHLLRTNQLAKELDKAKRDFTQGKKNWKILKSLEDLK